MKNIWLVFKLWVLFPVVMLLATALIGSAVVMSFLHLGFLSCVAMGQAAEVIFVQGEVVPGSVEVTRPDETMVFVSFKLKGLAEPTLFYSGAFDVKSLSGHVFLKLSTRKPMPSGQKTYRHLLNLKQVKEQGSAKDGKSRDPIKGPGRFFA